MKSSTLYRSNLSKETIQQLEGFQKQNTPKIIKSQNMSNEQQPLGVYVRPKKNKELDTLLNNFSISSASEKSPVLYLVSGFLIGAVCMFLMSALISLGAKQPEEAVITPEEISQSVMADAANASTENSEKVAKMVQSKEQTKKSFWGFTKKQKASNNNVTILPADIPVKVVSTVKEEHYTVQSGDTLDAIIMRFYGRYDTSKIGKIAERNNLSNPNALSIGQKLIIPLN